MANGHVGFATAQAILDHPGFSAARTVYFDAILSLYESNPAYLEIMRDGGRIFVYGVVMGLWGAYREDEEARWPTMSRLKDAVASFGVVSPRQVDLIVGRFVQVGHLSVGMAPKDRRKRLVFPTAALIVHDRAFIRAHYSPLAVLLGQQAYHLPLAGDLAYLKAMRGAWIATLDTLARDVVHLNHKILRFYATSGGMLMLMRLARLQEDEPTEPVALDYSDLARRFGVSRTHVRTLLGAAAEDGDVEIIGRGSLRLGPHLRAALDRNIADRLLLLDRAHRMAMESLEADALLSARAAARSG